MHSFIFIAYVMFSETRGKIQIYEQTDMKKYNDIIIGNNNYLKEYYVNKKITNTLLSKITNI